MIFTPTSLGLASFSRMIQMFSVTTVASSWKAIAIMHFEEAGIPPLVEDNHSGSSTGGARGLHFQHPLQTGKVDSCGEWIRVRCAGGYSPHFRRPSASGKGMN